MKKAKFTLKVKRQIVRDFWDGKSCLDIASNINPERGLWTGPVVTDIEQVIRDYGNGKFQLKPKRKAGGKQ